MNDKQQLLDRLENETRVLRDREIKRVFTEVDRKDFVTPDYEVEAYEDYSLPIGHDQTISQPTTVAFMLELLEIKVGDHVLDVGSGSGWTTTLLAKMVGDAGSVVGLEIIPDLAELGKRNIKKYDLANTNIHCSKAGDWIKKHKESYDKILVSASADTLPSYVDNALIENGILVIPIKDSIVKFRKTDGKIVEEAKFPGFAFVPLI